MKSKKQILQSPYHICCVTPSGRLLYVFTLARRMQWAQHLQHALHIDTIEEARAALPQVQKRKPTYVKSYIVDQHGKEVQ